jgi:hypothetical protein
MFAFAASQKWSPIVNEPLLVEAPASAKDLQAAVKRRFGHYWNGGGGSDKAQEARFVVRDNGFKKVSSKVDFSEVSVLHRSFSARREKTLNSTTSSSQAYTTQAQ